MISRTLPVTPPKKLGFPEHFTAFMIALLVLGLPVGVSARNPQKEAWKDVGIAAQLQNRRRSSLAEHVEAFNRSIGPWIIFRSLDCKCL